MIGVRLNTFNDNSIGEPEQDANSALTELDKGLRSSKVGEQCEAIVRFPRLFEKYPFPILINSSFLKLADVFRVGNNFLRLWVLRVCQQSEKHLDKILNLDEFLRRIYSVLHSNDPVARALALRTLGAVAGIIPERQNVHHAIRRGLDSHDDVEVEAAIYATTKFAAHSNTFAVSMCNKLSDMVECENTGAERRAKLVRALRTVHGGAVRAHGVLKLLRSVLDRFPSTGTVRAAILALTAIANDTVVHVPDQVELLLSLAVNDARSSVRRAALLSLKKLADHAAFWPSQCIQSLVLAASARNDDTTHTMLCLEVMQILVKCPAVCAAAGPTHSSSTGTEVTIEPNLLRKYCMEATLSMDLRVASTAADVLTHIVVYCYQESLPVEGADLMLSLESLVVTTGLPGSQDYIKPLRIVLRCLVQLSNAEPATYAPRTARVLGAQLNICKWDDETPSNFARMKAILEALGALGGMTYCPLSIKPAMPAIVKKLKEIAASGSSMMANEMGERMDVDYTLDSKEEGMRVDKDTALVLICTVSCQERAGTSLESTISPQWEATVLKALATTNGWTNYRVAKAALRYGHQQLAADVLARLTAAAPSEAALRWLGALQRAAAADAALAREGINSLEAARAAWELAGGAGGAGAAGGGACAAGCAGCGACSPFGAAWMGARAAELAALARAVAAARALCSQPPPAIAHAHAQSAREPWLRAGACAASCRRAARALAAAAERFRQLAATAFHADRATLAQLHISQHKCNLFAQFLERITSSNYQDHQTIELTFSGKELTPTNLEEKIMLNVCKKLEDISTKLFDNPTTKPGITHRHMEGVLAGALACCAGALWSRGASSGRAGGARCRVALSPAARAAPEHAAALPLSHHLALRIEGVILPPVPPSKRQEQRQVKLVQLTVTATPHPRNSDKVVLRAVQSVAPVRDFFAAQQLVCVGAASAGAGLYAVAVEAAFVDQHGQLWNTGPRTSIVIKAHEDPTSKSSGQATRGRF